MPAPLKGLSMHGASPNCLATQAMLPYVEDLLRGLRNGSMVLLVRWLVRHLQSTLGLQHGLLA